MKTSVKTELANHLLNLINDGVLTNDNKDDWHFHAFNEDYYLIGYYNCSEWLKKHDIDTYEAIAICQDYELEMFGEFQTRYDNPETTVNMLVYIYGEELINEFEGETIKELKDFCISI
tara:strand:+ start:2640 stop:2993 length:354 start_codon:yes stop_codon:yes gene_type:complete